MSEPDVKKKSQARVIKELLEQVEQKLGQGNLKVTLADYIRLVQLRKELEEEAPKEIKVTWIERDTEAPESSSGT